MMRLTMSRRSERNVDGLAVAAGIIRLASGVSFLVAPEAANRLWGDDEDSGPTASLLLRSMGYRDALIGGCLLASALRGGAKHGRVVPGLGRRRRRRPDRGAGQPPRMSLDQQRRGLGGAAVGVAIGLLGAGRAQRRARVRDSP